MLTSKVERREATRWQSRGASAAFLILCKPVSLGENGGGVIKLEAAQGLNAQNKNLWIMKVFELQSSIKLL